MPPAYSGGSAWRSCVRMPRLLPAALREPRSRASGRGVPPPYSWGSVWQSCMRLPSGRPPCYEKAPFQRARRRSPTSAFSGQPPSVTVPAFAPLSSAAAIRKAVKGGAAGTVPDAGPSGRHRVLPLTRKPLDGRRDREYVPLWNPLRGSRGASIATSRTLRARPLVASCSPKPYDSTRHSETEIRGEPQWPP